MGDDGSAARERRPRRTRRREVEPAEIAALERPDKMKYLEGLPRVSLTVRLTGPSPDLCGFVVARERDLWFVGARILPTRSEDDATPYGGAPLTLSSPIFPYIETTRR